MPNKSRSTCRVALLDIDGTLVDSNDAHARAWEEALRDNGHAVDFVRIRPLIGMGGDKLLPSLVGVDDESAEGQAIADRRAEIFEHLRPALRPTPGARPLLLRLKEEGLKLAVATSADGGEVKQLLKIAGVADLIDAASSSDDAEHSKPDPDIVKAALSVARVTAPEAIMIGDTPYDIEAASRAGVRIVALRCGGWWSDQDLAGAIAIYDDPADLLNRFDSSPFRT